MKKFSNITGEKVNTTPPTNEPTKEELGRLQLKSQIMNLLDEYLSIQSLGSVRRSLFNNSIKIDGKERFADALIDLLNEKDSKETVKVLESLKSENRDWVSIDNRINKINNKLIDSKFLLENKNRVRKIKSFLELYSNKEDFEAILDNHVNRIKGREEAYLRSIVANKLMENQTTYSKEKLNLISEKFLSRAKELGYTL